MRTFWKIKIQGGFLALASTIFPLLLNKKMFHIKVVEAQCKRASSLPWCTFDRRGHNTDCNKTEKSSHTAGKSKTTENT